MCLCVCLCVCASLSLFLHPTYTRNVMIANMYMGAELKGGIGSVFDMGHFVILAAYSTGVCVCACVRVCVFVCV